MGWVSGFPEGESVKVHREGVKMGQGQWWEESPWKRPGAKRTFLWRPGDLGNEGGVGDIPRAGKSKVLFLSDVSEEMYNRILWWLKGLCSPFLWRVWGWQGRREGGLHVCCTAGSFKKVGDSGLDLQFAISQPFGNVNLFHLPQ